MQPSWSLVTEVVISGVLLGGLYGAVSVGFSIAFGLVNVVNIAHPVVVVLGAYCVLYLAALGVDPVLTGIAAAPLFGVVGYFFYRGYSAAFERRQLSSLNGLTFFFGLMFVLEIGLTLAFGVDYRYVTAASATGTLELGGMQFPLRLLTPFLMSVALTIAITVFLRRTFLGQALAGVAQDELAVRLVGADPAHVKGIGFSIAMATAAIAGSLLIMAAPVYPASGREFIGRMFAVAVLGGAGSARGALAAGIVLGVVESSVQTFAGAQWSIATGFAILLITLGIRPQGIFSK